MQGKLITLYCEGKGIKAIGHDAPQGFIVRSGSLAAISQAKDPAAERSRLTKDYETKFANPYVAAEAGYIDEVIEPATTRKRLIDSLEMLKNKRDFNPPKKHGNIPL